MAAKKTVKSAPKKEAVEKEKPAKKTKSPAKKTKAKSKAAPRAADAPPSLASMYAGIVDSLDKSLNLRKGNARMLKPISTGLLVPDFVTGGGVNSTFTMISGEKASGKCLVGSTIVNTSEGFQALSEVASGMRKGFNPSALKVSTARGHRSVSHVYVDKSRTVKAETSRGPTIEGTPEHRMLVLTEDLRHVWRPLADIKVGDWIVSDTQQKPIFGKDTRVNKSMASVLGYLTANGQRHRFSSGDAGVIRRFSKAVKDVTGQMPSRTPSRNIFSLHIPHNGRSAKGNFFTEVLNPLGFNAVKSRDKVIPAAVMRAPAEILHEYLEAYFECDSGIDGNRVCICSASKRLTEQLSVLLQSIYGIFGRHKEVVRSLRHGRSEKYHYLILPQEDSIRFLAAFKRAKVHKHSERVMANSHGSTFNVVPFLGRAILKAVSAARVSPKKGDSRIRCADGSIMRTLAYPSFMDKGNKRLAEHHVSWGKIKRSDGAAFFDGLKRIDPLLAARATALIGRGFRYEQIVKVTTSRSVKPVYDLTVPTVKQFLANGLVAHNTTLSMMGLAASVQSNVPLVIMIDAEGTISLDYSESVFQSFDIGDVFENGRARYYNQNVIEDVSALLAGIVRKLPDKIYLEDEKTWAYAVPKGTTGTEMVANLEKAGLKPDRKLSASGSGKTWYFPTSYDGPEAVIIVDSWAAMMPRNLAETEGDLAGGMAVNARAFSKELPRFVGSLKQKGIALWSINQLRNDPSVRYGDPLKEKGGEALQFAAGIMCRTYSRAVPQGLIRDKEAYSLEIEPSITKKGGHDRYAWKQFVNTKNKFGRPFLKGMMRVWVADAEGKARGFDPVQDTLEFLQLTGQISGTRKKLKIDLRPGVKVPPPLSFLSKRTMTYMEFKMMILAAHIKGDADLVKRSKATFKTDRAPDLRAHLFKQLREDKTLWASQVTSDKAKVSEDDSEAETDE